MGSSFNLDFVRSQWGPDEASALRSMADSQGCYRIYKTGDENGWRGYKPIDYPEEERDVLTSPYVRYAVLVYDRGKVINVDGLWEKSPLLPRKKDYSAACLAPCLRRVKDRLGKEKLQREKRRHVVFAVKANAVEYGAAVSLVI